MSIMDSEKESEIREQSTKLRQELKEWEKSFAAANEGRKAGRHDIKQQPTIASKYKEYTKLRDVLSGKAPIQHSSSPHAPPLQPHSQPQDPSEPVSKKRKLSHHHTEQSSQLFKPSRQHSTPSKLRPTHPSDFDPYDSPSTIRTLFQTPPNLRTSIGPTPQKDGKVLGLFDALPSSPYLNEGKRTTLGPVTANSQQLKTPSKSRSTTNNGDHEVCLGTGSALKRKHSRTPTSTGKRFLLDTFATPTTCRILNPTTSTPTATSVSKLQFSTPSFLRRDSQRITLPAATTSGPARDGDGERNTNGEATSPILKIRMPTKPHLRGLSSMLAGLRKMEDERLDDEMDVLHQIELENHVQTKGGGVLVQDSQAVDMPLGVDRGSEDEDDDNYDNNNSNTHLQPNRTGSKAQSKDAKTPIGKVWKKKGQKRTTRRVLMKPSRSKPMPEPVWPVYHSDDDAVGVVETQVQAQDQRNKLVDEDEGNEDEDGYLADEHDVKPNNRDSTDTTHPHTTNLPATRKTTTTSANPTTMATATKDLLKKTAKKISATAHANYTRLKLRHKNTKGKSGARGRFGRR